MFNIQYGPISAAMNLAQMAGKGQFNQQQFQNDNEFLNTLNSAQKTEDARRATDMQTALGYADTQQKGQLAQAQMQMAGQYHQAQLAGLNAYRGGLLNNRQENTGIRQQALGDKEQASATQQAALSGMNPNDAAYYQAYKQAPPPLNRTSAYQAVQDQVNNLSKAQTLLAAQGKNLAMEEQNPITKAKTGRIIPRPGMQNDYQQWLAQVKQNNDALTNARGQLQQLLQGGAPAPAARPAPQITPQQQQQTAQAASGGLVDYSNDPNGGALPPNSMGMGSGEFGQGNNAGPTAVNPNTGQRIRFDATSNQWVPIQ